MIKPGITRIGKYAFAGCKNLRIVTLPDTLRVIGAHAFDGCSKLIRCDIPDSVTGGIGKYAFRDCKRLQRIHIPLKNQLLHSTTLLGCRLLRKAIIGAETLAPRCLEKKLFLEEVTPLPGVRHIGDNCFNGCKKLEKLTFSDAVRTIGCYAFGITKTLKTLHLNVGLRVIGKGAFCMCGAEEVTIPGSVSHIEDTAFCHSYMTKLTLCEGVHSIGCSAFSCCHDLCDVRLPKTLAEIEYASFQYCHSLISVTIPMGAHTIHDDAFSGCTALELNVPDSVHQIASNAFREVYHITCSGLPDRERVLCPDSDCP